MPRLSALNQLIMGGSTRTDRASERELQGISGIREVLLGNPEFINQLNESGYYPLELIPTKSEDALEVAKILLKSGADSLQKKPEGQYCLQYFLQSDHCIVELLITNLKNRGGVIELDDDEVIAETEETSIEAERQRMPLVFYVAKHGKRSHLKLMKKYFGDECLKITYRNQNLLSYVLSRKKYKMVVYLLKNGLDVNSVDKFNSSAFQCLVRLDDPNLEVFFKQSTDFGHLNGINESFLHDIARAGSYRVLDFILENHPELLEENGVEIDQKNNRGDTPLMVAIKKLVSIEKEELEKLFADSEWSADSESETAESTETFKRKREKRIREEIEPYIHIVKCLLYCEADPNEKNIEEQTVFDIIDEVNLLDGFVLPDDFKKRLVNQSQLINIEKEVVKILESHQLCGLGEAEATDFKKELREFVTCKIQSNAFDDALLQEETDRIEKLLKIIEDKPYINYLLMQLYELLSKLKHDNFDFKLTITERHKQVKEPKESYFYTFLNGEVYRLTYGNPDHIAYQLMTTLVYEARRHNWEDPICDLHRQLIKKINGFEADNLAGYSKELERIEKRERDYFGENVSDNSDSEDERTFRGFPTRNKHLLQKYSYSLFLRTQHENLLAKETKKLNQRLSDIEKIFGCYDRQERQKIVRDEPISDQVQKDLETLNMLSMRGELDEETIGMVQTKFLIAQYRGVAYYTDKFNKPQRERHRKRREETLPLFSQSVLEGGEHEDFYKNELDAEAKNKLLIKAEELEDRLKQLSRTDAVSSHFIGDVPYHSNNALEALQDFYTKSYDKFHTLLERFCEKLKIGTPISNLEDAILFSIQTKGGFLVSTSDTPDHALRYAYGVKYYKSRNEEEGRKEKRLRPRWRKDGLVERPYSGKVYISLHDPLELIKNSHHVPSMDREGLIHINEQILHERETSFLSYISGDRVVSQHVAKFPSFKSEYKNIFLQKYGLTEDLYEQFKREICDPKAQPHMPQSKRAKNLLTAHLISFHEVCLIEEAKIAAMQKGATLIYRNEHGGFSLYPCVTKVSDRVAEHAAIEDTSERVGDKRKYPISALGHRQRKRTRRGGVDIADGFLNSLISNYKIIYNGNQDSLLSSVKYLLADKESAEILEIRRQVNQTDSVGFFKRQKGPDLNLFFKNASSFLSTLADKYKVKFNVHSPDFDKGSKMIGDESYLPEYHLYYGGGALFGALEEKVREPVLAMQIH